MAKEGNPSFQTFKNRMFKYDQKFGAKYQVYKSGKNPIISNNKIIVHHPYGRKGANLYKVVGVTQEQHLAIHHIIGYRNPKWNGVEYILGKGLFK